MSQNTSLAGSDLTTWQQLVFPRDYRNPAPAPRYNLVVIGAGPAGLIAAIGAAGLGAKVALIERHAMGGDCLNVGCVPSKTLLAAAFAGLDSGAALARVRAVRAAIAEHDSVQRYRAAGVDVFLGEGSFISATSVRVASDAHGDATLQARKVVIATGARAALPPIPGLAESAPLTNETIFELATAPKRLAIIGGGPIGCELAQAFARLGTQVDLVELLPRLMPADESEAAELVASALRAVGVQLHLGAGLKKIGRDASGRTLHLESGASIVCDELLVAAGRQRNLEELGLDAAGIRWDAKHGIEVDAQLRTSARNVFAIGDVGSRLQFTHHADAQARIVLRNALFLGRARADTLVVPWCTYTKPEVAHVGATRAALTASDTRFTALRVDFKDLDRGRTDNTGDGYAEVLLAAGSDKLLGASIVGNDAGEQIAPLVMMMTLKIGFGALGSLLLPYPTRSEYLRRLADAWNRTRLTPRNARLLSWWLRRTR